MIRFDRLSTHGPLTIDALPGQAQTLVISFASIGQDPARPPSPEFVGTATDQDRPALFVSDESRSWGKVPGLIGALSAAIDSVVSRQPITQIIALGQSMGGAAALVAAAALPIDLVLAFSPQSHLGPAEPRWQPWAARLPRDLTPAASPAPGQHWTLMHGLADDRQQALGFAPAPGLDHILYPGLSHSALCPHLKQRGVLKGLLAAAIDRDRRRLLRIAASSGGHLRAKLGV